jgi:hypothetical protein
MGNVIQARSMPSAGCAGCLKPIIYCTWDEALEAGAEPINLALAQKLKSIRPARRTMRLESCFGEVLGALPDDVVIKDFDVMFNPAYKVDVLKLLTVACKKKPFRILWPGRYENGKLFYAEDGYPDYHVFSVEDYDVTCIV